MEREYIKDVLKGKKGKKTILSGWVHDTRALGKIKFLVLRDPTGRIQITAPEAKVSKQIFQEIDKIPRESVVKITGQSKESKQAPGGVAPRQGRQDQCKGSHG